jgi:hypothetical protein
VGSNLKEPLFPLWVVSSESHFTMLALHALRGGAMSSGGARNVQGGCRGGGGGGGRGGGGCSRGGGCGGGNGCSGAGRCGAEGLQPPLTLAYYDGLGRQAAPIFLDLSPPDPSGPSGWTSRMAGVEGDRGTSGGRPVPPLEAVVETRWPGVGIAWRGSEPLL